MKYFKLSIRLENIKFKKKFYKKDYKSFKKVDKRSLKRINNIKDKKMSFKKLKINKNSKNRLTNF